MSELQTDDKIKQAVRETYGKVATQGAGCGCSASSCCSADATSIIQISSERLGYSVEELGSVPEGANMGLGCGNPQAIASLKPGETVLDLGSGGGFDSFLAARQVGETGRVIGVDMTPEMVAKARANAEKGGFSNVEFHLGEIENLPVPDATVDVILSNCVINLSPDKPRVFAEAYRVLKSGGRLAVSDVVATAPLPEEARRDLALHAACVAGAAMVDEVKEMLEKAGFVDIRIDPLDKSREIVGDWVSGADIANYILSATIEATKP